MHGISGTGGTRFDVESGGFENSEIDSGVEEAGGHTATIAFIGDRSQDHGIFLGRRKLD